ncbi:prokaryotic type I DNA topoisomerase [Venturia nashicola]|nr:prokaryotic type I DNA topoisomerase [Venturia nashicola]
MRILCVAEKPSIAKAVANHLGGQVPARNVRGLPWLKNYVFNYNFGAPWNQCSVTFTSVAGHIVSQDFEGRYKSWQGCNPGDLFEAPIISFVQDDKKAVSRNIADEARRHDLLYIWTDCDREGENIGAEIRDIARKANPRIQVKRARFSNIERAHVTQAARNPVDLDERQVNAVSARMEIDLRTGAAFTRVLSLAIKPMVQHVQELTVFPTLGFVVDRYFRVRNFIPETFWGIKVTHKKDDIKVNFNWKRVHLFDRMAVTIVYERCLHARVAKVVKMNKRPTSKWRPLPLTTVELQKNGSRFLRMNSQTVMKIAEDLYTKGWISYPRTETDQFDKGMDLRGLVQRQTQSTQWGQFATDLMNGGFQWPKSGRNNDKAHPPIHPVNFVVPTSLNNDEERRVYEFVVRRFLACCSEDARGELSNVDVEYGNEEFHASGLMVMERNYLDVYPYDKWESSSQLPVFTVGETFIPTEAKMNEGKTCPPGYLTEPELIGLMDANGIGTDATMAEHIANIQKRMYVETRTRSSGAAGRTNGNGEEQSAGRGGRGGGRGRGRGRGGAATGNGGGGGGAGVQEFIPTTLGVSLIEGYEGLNFETSLSKPFLRKEMELQMKAICEGTTTRHEVVQQNLERYRAVFVRTMQQMDVIKAAVRKYVLNQGNG